MKHQLGHWSIFLLGDIFDGNKTEYNPEPVHAKFKYIPGALC